MIVFFIKKENKVYNIATRLQTLGQGDLAQRYQRHKEPRYQAN
jgi:hypothetical protein